MPNLDPWINQQSEEEFTTSSKFENNLLSIKDEHQKMIRPNCHPAYNERHKIIEYIDWTLEKYKESTNIEKKNQQNNEETIIIDNIIEELDKKRDIAINKKRKAFIKEGSLNF